MDKARRNIFLGVSAIGAASIAKATTSPSTQTTQTTSFPYSFNVCDFGASPTTTSDSTQAFRDAISAASGAGSHGGLVVVPSGHYYLSGTLELPSYVSLVGPGTPHSTILDFSNQTMGSAIKIAGFGHVRVCGLAIMYPSAHGIEIEDAAPNKNFCHFSDVYIEGAGGSGFSIAHAFMTTLERCWVKGASSFGFHFKGFHTSIKLDTCWADSCADTGFNINSTVYSSLNNCGADANGSYGYFLSNCQGIAMNGCGAEGNHYSSLGMAATDGWAASSGAAEGFISGITVNSFYSLEGNQSGLPEFGTYLTLYTENGRRIDGISSQHHSRGGAGPSQVVKRGLDVVANINFPVVKGATTVA